MDNSMVPAGGNPGGALAPAAQKGIVAPTMGMMGGGGGFSETWAINKDEHVFFNKKTSEKRRELYIIVDEMHPNRALFPKVGPQKGERACYSEDGIASYQGIACASCPHISEVNEYNKYYEANPTQQRPQQYAGDCSLRYSIYWTKEFLVNPDGSLTLQVHEQRVLLNAPKSSIYAIWGRGAYKSKLDQAGQDIKAVVTRVKIAQRKNEDMNSVYDYADFEFVDTVENVMPKVTKTVQIASNSNQSAPQAASFPGGGLPTMAGLPPATAGFPSAAPAPGFPGVVPGATTAGPVGFGSAPVVPTTTVGPVPGFPGATSAAPIPGFPGVTSASPAPAPAQAAAPAPSFNDFTAQAKAKVVADFGTLSAPVQAMVLNVLGLAKIADLPNEKVATATQAVNSAKSFSPAPTAVAAGNPF